MCENCTGDSVTNGRFLPCNIPTLSRSEAATLRPDALLEVINAISAIPACKTS